MKSNQDLFKNLKKKALKSDLETIHLVEDAVGQLYDLLAKEKLTPQIKKQQGPQRRTRTIDPLLALGWNRVGLRQWEVGAVLGALVSSKANKKTLAALNEALSEARRTADLDKQNRLHTFAKRHIGDAKVAEKAAIQLFSGDPEIFYPWYWSAEVSRLRFQEQVVPVITPVVLEWLANEKRQQVMDRQREEFIKAGHPADENTKALLSLRVGTLLLTLWKYGPAALGLDDGQLRRNKDKVRKEKGSLK